MFKKIDIEHLSNFKHTKLKNCKITKTFEDLHINFIFNITIQIQKDCFNV